MKQPNFSHRTSWHRQPNRLTELLEARRREGKPIIDLTVSNPTECGFIYPEQEIFSAISNPQSIIYRSDPRGLLFAREAVAEYYRDKNISIDPTNIFLTASTSEAYSILFKLLCNAGESVLVPRPSYPLFDYLAQLNDVQLQYYNLRYDGEWHINIDSLNDLMIENIGKNKAIVIVNPHNPTGLFLKKDEFEAIKDIAKQYNLALIVDEVFIDYPLEDEVERIPSTAGESEVLTFTLNGISKAIGLPQMKLGWMVVSGQLPIVNEAMERLDIICDTFLSVNTPVQAALPKLFEHGKVIHQNILERVRSNYTTLKSINHETSCSLLTVYGGWYGILRVPRTKTDEEWALQLLENKYIYVHPGYFFDFEDDGYLIISLLPEERLFVNAIQEMVSYISAV